MKKERQPKKVSISVTQLPKQSKVAEASRNAQKLPSSFQMHSESPNHHRSRIDAILWAAHSSGVWKGQHALNTYFSRPAPKSLKICATCLSITFSSSQPWNQFWVPWASRSKLFNHMSRWLNLQLMVGTLSNFEIWDTPASNVTNLPRVVDCKGFSSEVDKNTRNARPASKC